jgi:uncharacterized protein (TIGR00369 family)
MTDMRPRVCSLGHTGAMSDRPLPSPELLAQYAKEFSQSHSLRHFGLQVSFPSPERVRITLGEVRPEHQGGLGSEAVNGGVMAAMFDLAIGCAPALVDPTRRTATMQLSMTFMKPVRGRSIHAEAWVDSAGLNTLFATAVIYDEQGNACARCQGVVKVSRKVWASGSSPAVN